METHDIEPKLAQIQANITILEQDLSEVPHPQGVPSLTLGGVLRQSR